MKMEPKHWNIETLIRIGKHLLVKVNIGKGYMRTNRTGLGAH